MSLQPPTSIPTSPIDYQSENQIQCVICFNFPTNSVIIPCCGQIACEKCIKTWLSANTTCPYCRHPLIIDSLVPIKWLDAFKSLFQLNFLKCQEHDKVFEFFCQTCQCYLCSHCLFNELQGGEPKHKSHKIIRFEELVLQSKSKIQEELVKVLPKVAEAENLMRTIQNHISSLDARKNLILNEMQAKYNQIQADIDKDFQEIEVNLGQEIQEVESAQRYVVNEIEQVKQFLDSNQSMSIESLNERLYKLEKLKKTISASNLRIEPQLINDLIVNFTEFPVYIQHFRETQKQYRDLPEDAHHFFYSSKIKLYGNTWRVKIYPNGHLNGAGTHLSVFIELLKGCGSPANYIYKLVIKNRSNLNSSEGEITDSQDITRQYSSEFSDSDSWGWNKVVSFETLYNGNYLDDDGGLPLILSIRADSNYQVYYDYEKAISRKKDKYLELEKKIKEMKNQRNDFEQEQS